MLTSPEWCVTSRLPESGPLTSGSFLGHRLPSQINTCLFCTLCPHLCAPGKNFPVDHPSPNCSGPSTLNLEVLWRPASEKEVVTCWYEYPINPIKPCVRMSQKGSSFLYHLNTNVCRTFSCAYIDRFTCFSLSR